MKETGRISARVRGAWCRRPEWVRDELFDDFEQDAVAGAAVLSDSCFAITDKLASYGAAKREIMPGIEHRQHKGLNNRAENSH